MERMIDMYEAGSRLWAVSTEPDVGQTHEPQGHDLSRSQTLNLLSHPGARKLIFLIITICHYIV